MRVLVLSLLLLPVPALLAQSPPAETDREIRTIEALVQQNRLDEAKAETRSALARNPKNVKAYVLLGVILAAQRDDGNATQAYQKALELDPSSITAHNNLGILYLTEKQGSQAETEFRAVLRLDPDNRDANYNLGILLLMKKDAAGAIVHFRKVKPEDDATRLQLVSAYFANHQPSQAMATADLLSAAQKDNVQVHFSLGVLLGSQKEYKAAQLELEKADALQPGTYEILFNLGLDLLRGGEFAKAEPVLNRALRLRPDSPDALYLTAQVLANESRPLDALELLVRARKLAPENVDILYLMAQLSMSQNFYEDAIPLLESGLKIDPNRPALVAALGKCYFLAGKAEKAIEVFNRLVEMDRSARSYAFLGMAYRNLGRFDEAKEKFKLGLQLDPKNSLCLYNLGFIAERQGDNAVAEKLFEQAVQSAPTFADALLELANLKITGKKPQEAEALLKRFVAVSRDAAPGYYKLAMIERSLHQMDAADRDLAAFKSLSKRNGVGPYPYQHLFDYLDDRSRLPAQAQGELDVEQLADEVKKHPDQTENLYFLAESYLKLGKLEEAKQTIAELDQASPGDYRMLTGVGVLMARYRLFDGAIAHFQEALQANSNTDEIRFDLADTYFRAHRYPEALNTALEVSPEGKKDEAFLGLLGDIYAHLGDTERASAIYRDAIARNPDNDQDYLSLALIQLRGGDVGGARQTLESGRMRVPESGKLFWGLGIISAVQGRESEAAGQLERAVDLLPEWPGGYSALGVFYFENGQISKAKEVFDRFKDSDASGILPTDRIEQALTMASDRGSQAPQAMTEQGRQQFLQWALMLADRTL